MRCICDRSITTEQIQAPSSNANSNNRDQTERKLLLIRRLVIPEACSPSNRTSNYCLPSPQSPVRSPQSTDLRCTSTKCEHVNNWISDSTRGGVFASPCSYQYSILRSWPQLIDLLRIPSVQSRASLLLIVASTNLRSINLYGQGTSLAPAANKSQ